MNRLADAPCPPPRLILVDDDDALFATVADMLGDDYRVEAGSRDPAWWLSQGEAADAPDAVLLDIELPLVSGYEICRALRGNPAFEHVPVIFMSGAVDLEQHLASDDAGGTDFLAKPFRVAELKHRLAAARHHAERQRALQSEARSAFSTAMTAMSSAAEMGTVLQFVQHSYAQDSLEALADCLAAACAEFGLHACVQLRGAEGTVTRGQHGAATPLERSILRQIADCGRIVDFRTRSAFNYPQATLMVVDMPVADPDRNGRLRDHLVVLTEAANARAQALDDARAATRQARLLTEILAQTQRALTDIDQVQRSGRARAVEIMHRMVDRVESSFLHLGLSGQQETMVAESLRFAVHETIDLFDRGLAIDAHLQAVAATLQSATQGGRSEARPG